MCVKNCHVHTYSIKNSISNYLSFLEKEIINFINNYNKFIIKIYRVYETTNIVPLYYIKYLFLYNNYLLSMVLN